jgi:MFS family permease
MVLGSAMMAVLGDRINLVLLYFVSIFVGASALVGAGPALAFVLALVALTVEGAATGIDNVATDTILQKRVPEAFLANFAIKCATYRWSCDGRKTRSCERSGDPGTL